MLKYCAHPRSLRFTSSTTSATGAWFPARSTARSDRLKRFTRFFEGATPRYVCPSCGRSPLLGSFRSTQNQGPFPPPELPGFHGTYEPLRRPPRPVPDETVEGQRIPRLDGPPVLRRVLSLCAAPTTPASHPEALAVVLLPDTAASPASGYAQKERVQIYSFRGAMV